MHYILYLLALLIFLVWIGGRQKPVHDRPGLLRLMGESLYPLFILAFIVALLGYWVSPNDSNSNLTLIVKINHLILPIVRFLYMGLE